MTPRGGKAFRPSAQLPDLAVTQRHAARIDIPARQLQHAKNALGAFYRRI
jgi:hypothetical protein